MRKFFLLLLASMTVFACSKEDDAPESFLRQDGSEGLIFHSSFEQPSEPDTKVFADDHLRLRWNADDRISIFVQSTRNKEFRFTGRDGDNGGDFEPVTTTFGTGNEVPHFYAVYPYSSTTSISDYEPYNISLNLPSVQTYKEGSFGVGANTMVAVSDDDFLGFKNVCGFLRFRFWGNNISIKSIKLEGNNGEKLAGKAVVTPVSGGNPSVVMDASATGSITLYAPFDETGAPVPVRIGSSSTEPTEFIFVLPPTTFTGGVKVTVTDGFGGVYEKTISSSAPFTINRSAMKSVPALEVTPDYTGINVEFSDPAFKAYCVSKANFDTDGDGEISLNEAKAQLNIDLTVADDVIRSLGGLEHFTNLVRLDVSGHPIENIPLSTLTKLQTFKCYYNNSATAIEFSNNPALLSADLRACTRLESLDVGGAQNLKQLICIGGQTAEGECVGVLSSINLPNNPALEQLYVRENNNLTSIDLSHCPALSSLVCYDNQLTSLDLSSNPEIDQVGAYNNKLTSITISGTANPKLRYLELGSNLFTRLTINNMPSLVTLIVDGCENLSILSAKNNVLQYLGVNECPALIEIDCGFNQLDSIGVTRVPSLQYLNCNDNKLKSLDVSQNYALIGLNCYANELTNLNVSSNSNLGNIGAWDNKLTSIQFSGDNLRLTDIHIDDNLIVSSDSLDLAAVSNLKHLYISNNRLTSLDLSANTKLTYLTCNNNQLSSLNLSNNASLTGLVCYNNALTSLDLSANHLLDQLECYNNNLTSLDVSGLTELWIFDCFGNNITTLDISNCNRLRYLAAWPQQNTLTTVRVKAGATVQYMLGEGELWPTINPADYGTTIVEVP